MNEKFSISSVIFICIAHLYSVNGQGGREVSALSDICNRFPSLASCKNAGQAQVPPQKPEPQIATPPSIPSNTDYCANYKENFVTYCNGRSRDPAVISFCNTYSSKCNTVWAIPTPASVPQTSAPSAGGNTPPSQQVVQPSQPLNPQPFQPQPLQPVNPQPFQPQQPQQKGLPQWLNNGQPLAGLGGSPNSLQQFGGPVNGGLGLGNQWQVPFVGASEGLNVVPTQGLLGGKSLNVAGLGFQQSQGINYGGLPGLSNLNNAWGLGPNALNGMQAPANNGPFGIGKRRRR